MEIPIPACIPVSRPPSPPPPLPPGSRRDGSGFESAVITVGAGAMGDIGTSAMAIRGAGDGTPFVEGVASSVRRGLATVRVALYVAALTVAANSL